MHMWQACEIRRCALILDGICIFRQRNHEWMVRQRTQGRGQAHLDRVAFLFGANPPESKKSNRGLPVIPQMLLCFVVDC
jgi:hypothetical protein